MIRIVEGNILNAVEDIIGHQVNCQGVMGSGVAKQIRGKYPVIFDEYRAMYKRASHPNELLGRHQFVKTEKHIVANLFGQLNYGRDKSIVYTDYLALGNALAKMKRDAILTGRSVALPYGIGCGFANGDWLVVSAIIEQVFADYEVTLYKYVFGG